MIILCEFSKSKSSGKNPEDFFSPCLTLADEPTGNLDLDTAEEIIDILYEMASRQGKCVIAVTHTPELAQRADVVLHIVDKCLREAVEDGFSVSES